MNKPNEELSNNKSTEDSKDNPQNDNISKDNQEVTPQPSYDDENEDIRRQMESNQIENERLTKRLEYMKQLNKEIKLSSEIDKLNFDHQIFN